MKANILWVIVLPCAIISCTTDNPAETIGEKVIMAEQFQSKAKVTGPQNSMNPYDIAGLGHNDVIDGYFSTTTSNTSIQQVNASVETLAGSISYVSQAANTASLNSKISDIQKILNDPAPTLETLIVNSPLSSGARSSFSVFVDSLFLMQQNEYENIHQFIVTYESSVSANTQFGSEDKRIILTTTSIARHSFYYSKRRKDKDWETSVGNIAGGFEGAAEGPALALKMAAVVGLCEKAGIKD